MSATTRKLVTLGRISGVYGVRGWVKVQSYCEPRGNIVGFDNWTVRQRGSERTIEVEEGREQGTNVVAKLRGVDDREAARELIGADIAVERSALPACGPGEYYWADLEGLEVVTVEGAMLGKVSHLVATGANDVLVAHDGKRERLIPFVIDDYVKEVDFESGRITVDWDPEF